MTVQLLDEDKVTSLNILKDSFIIFNGCIFRICVNPSLLSTSCDGCVFIGEDGCTARVKDTENTNMVIGNICKIVRDRTGLDGSHIKFNNRYYPSLFMSKIISRYYANMV